MNSPSSVKRNRRMYPGNSGLHHVAASPQSQAGCGGKQQTQPELSLLHLLEGEMCKAIFKLSEGYHPREQIKKWVKVLEAGFSLWERASTNIEWGKVRDTLCGQTELSQDLSLPKQACQQAHACIYAEESMRTRRCMYVYSKHTDAHVPEPCVYGFTYVYICALFPSSPGCKGQQVKIPQ